MKSFLGVSLVALVIGHNVWARLPELSQELAASPPQRVQKEAPDPSWAPIDNNARVNAPKTTEVGDSWVDVKPQSLAEFTSNMRIGSIPVNEVRKALELSDLAYRKISTEGDKRSVLSRMEEEGTSLTFVHGAGNTQASVVIAEHKDGSVTVAFKGTSTLEEWWNTNFAILPVQDRETGIAAHGGFLRKFSDLQSSIDKALENIAARRGVEVSDLPVTVTGHSLGGALAQLTAARLSAEGVVPTLITFGAPGVFLNSPDLGSFEALRVEQFRSDPVPHSVPYATKLPGQIDVAVPDGKVPHTLGGYNQGLEDTILEHAAQGRGHIPTVDENRPKTFLGRVASSIARGAGKLALKVSSGLSAVANFFRPPSGR